MPGVGDEIVALFAGGLCADDDFRLELHGELLLAVPGGGGASIVPYRILWTVAVFFGVVTLLDLAWTIADTLNALMAVPNLLSLLALSPIVVQLTRERLLTALEPIRVGA